MTASGSWRSLAVWVVGLKGASYDPCLIVFLRKTASRNEKLLFKEMAQKCAVLSHPNVTKVMATCLASEPLGVVIEFTTGDLKELLLSKAPTLTDPGKVPLSSLRHLASRTPT